MVICPDCGKEVPDAKFCKNCGSRLPETEEVVSEEIENTKGDVPVENEIFDDVNVDVPEEIVVDATPVKEPVEEEVPEEIVVETKNKKTKFCPNCGTEVGVEIAFCPNCGFKLIKEEKPQTKFCQNCGKKIDINAEICPHCGVRVANVSTISDEKNVLLSAILSFLFPGLGHLYLGLTKKGISFIIAYIISFILVFILIGIVLLIVIWVWALVDVIKSTEAINRGEFVEDKLF